MDKNKMTFCELVEIIDRYIEEKSNITLVCDNNLKELIAAEYLYDEYDLIDDEEATDCDEYYISLRWYDGVIEFIIEDATYCTGEYKSSDATDIDYFIFSDMDIEIVVEKLIGDIMFCELIDCENCECEDGDNVEDEDIDPELEFLLEKTEELLENDFCPNCAFDFVKDIFETAYGCGFDDCKLNTQEFLGSFDGNLLP